MDSRLMMRGVRVRCPGCGETATLDVVLLADAGDNPRWTRKVLDEDVNQIQCAACGRSYLAPSPLLYRDPARELAVAYVPSGTGDAQALAGALVSQALEVLGVEAADDWLLTPKVVDEPKGLRRLVLHGTDDPEEAVRPALGAALDLAQRNGAYRVADALTLLAPVNGLAELLTLLNDHSELLDPPLRREAKGLLLHAQSHELAVEAAVLSDLLALLHAHTPPEADDEEQDETVPEEVRDRLVAGDLEAATDFLDRPVNNDAANARRAVRDIEPDDAERREGFYEHAALFSTLLSDMMEPQAPDHPAPPAPTPHAFGVPQGALDKLLAAPSPDLADEVLEAHPELLNPQTIDAIRLAITQAIDSGDESASANFGMILNVLLTAGADELEEDRG